jgi:uncharacterized protein (DUF1330 family)
MHDFITNMRYNIYDQYAIPSAFGINKKRIDEYVITSRKLYYDTIVSKIKNIQDNRPIIVFFKTSRELNEFFNSPEYMPFLSRTSSLTEKHDAETRDSKIFQAADPKSITLMSSSFGRGTDFAILND